LNDQRPVIAQVLHRLDRAGAEVLVDALARGLGERYRFVFFCLDGIGPLGESLRDDGFEVVALNRRPGIDRAVTRRLRGLLTQHKVDLIHAHQYTPFFYSAIARGLFRRSAMAVLFTEHGRHYPDRRSNKRVLANKFLLKKQDRVTAVSAFIRESLADNEGIDRGRIEVVYNGITPCSFGGTPTAVASGLREELDLSSDDFIIVQVARFHPVKDHATAVAAFALVHRELPNAHLVMIGSGERQDEIAADITARGLSSNIHLLGERDDIRELLHHPGAGADVAMLSSLSEGLSVTLLEAASAELPIAATDVGGNREIVIHNETGLLSERGDARGLADNLIALLGDGDLRQSLGQAGRQRYEAHFTQCAMHARFAGIYDAMLGG